MWVDAFEWLSAIERRRRVQLTVAAYAYEIANRPTMSDAHFDKIACEIDLTIRTGRDDLDKWWIENFQPHTGQWIHDHPELDKARRVYEDITR